jgi:anti-sigma regulatory factor (Ser/Thr protein kinase)
VISKPSRHCTVELQALPSRISQVRRIVSAQLRYWHLDSLIELATLGVTELLSNVHRHAEPDKHCTVRLELLPDQLTVSVHDHDPRLPESRPADLLATNGRGLALIAAVSENWGVRSEDEGGKIVWFTLPAPTHTSQPYSPVYGAATASTFADAELDALAQSAPARAAARSAVAG